MQNRSFVKIIRAAIRAGVVAIAASNTAFASWQYPTLALPGSCMVHDMGYEFVPLRIQNEIFETDNFMGPLPNNSDNLDSAVAQSELDECIRMAGHYDHMRRVQVAWDYIRGQFRSSMTVASDAAVRYGRWHDSMRYGIEHPGPMLSDFIGLHANESAYTAGEMYAMTNELPLHCGYGMNCTPVLAQQSGLHAENIAMSEPVETQLVDEWDCDWARTKENDSIATKPFGTLESGQRANMFVFHYVDPNKLDQETYAESSPVPPQLASPELTPEFVAPATPIASGLPKTWNAGVDPICNEMFYPAHGFGWHALYQPNVCILAPELLEPNVIATSEPVLPLADSTESASLVNDSAMHWLTQNLDWVSPNTVSQRITSPLSPRSWQQFGESAWRGHHNTTQLFSRFIDEYAVHAIRFADHGASVQSLPDSLLVDMIAPEQFMTVNVECDDIATAVPMSMIAESENDRSALLEMAQSTTAEMRLGASRQIASQMRILGNTLIRWSDRLHTSIDATEIANRQSGNQSKQ